MNNIIISQRERGKERVRRGIERGEVGESDREREGRERWRGRTRKGDR